MDSAARAALRREMPVHPTDLARVHQDFLRDVLPYATGNVHPGFMGWVHGGGTAVGMLADMLAAGLNPHCGGRDHAPIEVERQITEWAGALFGFPAGPRLIAYASSLDFARYLEARVAAEPRLELLAPVQLNIDALVKAVLHHGDARSRPASAPAA